MKFINEVVNGGVTIILLVVTNLVCVLKKRNFRRLWITRINAVIRERGVSYSFPVVLVDDDGIVRADVPFRRAEFWRFIILPFYWMGVIHVQASFNNTIVTVTDVWGRVVSWSSAGTCGFKGTRRETPFATQTAAANAIRTVVDQGMQRAEVMIKGPGLGRSKLREIN
ncbi:30S ribosomal protein S11 [Forsythia ovata]|uniref:Large ribosomal subunit protein bL20c n=1 Tax=Forsythia ovata TaxID=205694 RepID=A0ABD1VJK7_9LAMI